MNDCSDKHFKDMLYAYELGLLSDEERRELELHMLECEHCRKETQEFRQVARHIMQDPIIRESIQHMADKEAPMETADEQTQTHVTYAKGTVISHYSIIEKIGAGGMGEVYLAEDTELKRQVALKFIPYQFMSDKDSMARFKREARATAAIEHPNIVTIYEVSEYQGRSFFAMEHIEGQPLRNIIKSKELSPNRVVELAIQICDGLSKAHEAGIVHRDIKPSNIVID